MSPVVRYVPSVVSLPAASRRRAGLSVPMLTYPLPQPMPRTVTKMPAGYAGTALTVGEMRKLIVQGSKTPGIREAAANLAMGYDSDRDRIGAIFEFVRRKMRYVRDPLSQELVAGAPYHFDSMIALGYARGDCDDHTVLLGAMLESVGYPTRITTARMRPGGGTDDHVYLEVNDRRSVAGNGWIPLDASNKKRGIGEQPPAQRIRRW